MAALVIGLAGCGGGGSSGGGSPGITVDISPKTASVGQGSTLQFNATVGGTTNTGVIWSVEGGAGSISSGGLYTAPAAPGTYSVKVTTQATPAASNTATVTVKTIPPLAWRAVSLAGAEFGEDTQAKLMTGTYDTDWTYPSANEAAYFKGKGMNMVRIPFRWERMQPTLNASLDANELGRLKTLVSGVTGNGMTVLLDVHNYARWGFDSNISSPNNLIGTTAVPVSAFVDLWTRLATEFKGNPNVMFGLMNEPHEIDVTAWVSAANQAIAAIRATGATNTITVGGVSWTGAWSWTDSTWKSGGTYNGDSNAVAMLNVTDSGNNLLFEVHQYLDKDYSGRYDGTKYPTSSNDCVYDYTTTLVKFTTWLKVNNKKGLLGEIGAPNTPTCNKAVADALSYVQANADVWAGWMWWAAGPWWGNYKLSLEPTWSGDYKTGTAVADKPQMSVLTPYLK